ncbi:MAG: MBL fold metallo-hydrolase [Clostridia bacterium]|nr:MBL fold metallo-hydrolase [Clostridia bacterium]
MQIYNLFPGSFASNCYLLIANGHAAVVDPSANADTILAEVKKSGAVLDKILLTHGHFDHIFSLDELREKTNAPAYIHKDDADMPEDAHKNAFYTFFHSLRSYRRPEHLLQDKDELTLGDEKITVLHTPGHTKGSVCYLCGDSLLLTGDTLFYGNIGRCDLYGGNEGELRSSLHFLRTLPPELRIYPGHGESCSLGEALNSLYFYD